MLVLNRAEGEIITIGDDIEVTIVSIRGRHVRVGISAPKSVPVHRKEVFDNIKKVGKRHSEINN